MVRRIVCSMCIAIVAAPALGAQIGRQRPTSQEPDYWVGLGLGYVNGVTMSDNGTGATWNFGYTSQLLATLEKRVAGGGTVGVGAGFSTMPLTYRTGLVFNGACPGSCEARADVSQYLVYLRTGSGGGFGNSVGIRPIFGVEGGVTRFSNFRTDTGSTRLEPSSARNDVTFGFATGLSFSLSRTAAIYASQSFQFLLHRQLTGVTNNSAPRLLVFRAGFELGF